MIYILYVMEKLNNKSMIEIFDMSRDVRKKHPKECERRFVKMRRNLNRICENKYLVKKYNLMCFKRSLILFYLASVCGIEVTFCMGFKRYPTLERKRNLLGHAWVERNGKPLDNGNENEYEKTYTRDNKE